MWKKRQTEKRKNTTAVPLGLLHAIRKRTIVVRLNIHSSRFQHFYLKLNSRISQHSETVLKRTRSIVDRLEFLLFRLGNDLFERKDDLFENQNFLFVQKNRNLCAFFPDRFTKILVL